MSAPYAAVGRRHAQKTTFARSEWLAACFEQPIGEVSK